jgi:hypothetical protein
VEELVVSMDPRVRTDETGVAAAAVDFVRFCHHRRRVGWPELYDEMCHVASRGLYHGWGFGELAEHGIKFSLGEMPRLARLVGDVVRADAERRGRGLVGVMAPVTRSEALEEVPEETHRGIMLAGAAR